MRSSYIVITVYSDYLPDPDSSIVCNTVREVKAVLSSEKERGLDLHLDMRFKVVTPLHAITHAAIVGGVTYGKFSDGYRLEVHAYHGD